MLLVLGNTIQKSSSVSGGGGMEPLVVLTCWALLSSPEAQGRHYPMLHLLVARTQVVSYLGSQS